MWTVPSGVTLTLEGFQIVNGAGSGFSNVDVSGTLTTWGMALTGGAGSAITVEAGGSATLNETQINGCTQNGVINKATLDLEHSDVIGCGQAGIDNGAGTTTTLNNSILTAQVGAECITAVQSTTASLDDDGSCGVAHSIDTSLDSDNLIPAANGGPTLSVQFPAGSSVTGDAASCPRVDERFFVNAGTCDIGAESASATRDTTPPTCAVTGGSAGPPKTQQVTVQDTGSGMGPEPGPATDNPTNTPPTTQPTSAVPVFGYGVSNLFINNGSFSWTPPTAPTTSGVVLTATKTDQTMLTHWNFTAMDWAGNSTFCN
jgi:hypothetical protein